MSEREEEQREGEKRESTERKKEEGMEGGRETEREREREREKERKRRDTETETERERERAPHVYLRERGDLVAWIQGGEAPLSNAICAMDRCVFSAFKKKNRKKWGGGNSASLLSPYINRNEAQRSEGKKNVFVSLVPASFLSSCQLAGRRDTKRFVF